MEESLSPTKIMKGTTLALEGARGCRLPYHKIRVAIINSNRKYAKERTKRFRTPFGTKLSVGTALKGREPHCQTLDSKYCNQATTARMVMEHNIFRNHHYDFEIKAKSLRCYNRVVIPCQYSIQLTCGQGAYLYIQRQNRKDQHTLDSVPMPQRTCIAG
jgi:hypothetical protein